VVFDVGANCGQFLKLAVNRLGDRLRAIHSFEPAAATFAELEQTAPRREGIVLNRLALGTAPGQAELYYDREKSGLASLTRRDLAFRDIEFDRHETVTLTTLDAYCADRGVTRVDWLKLDVEGHELDVLRGGARLFSRGAVDRVTFEFGGCNIDTRTFVRDFHQFFGAHGMDLFRITPGGHLHPLRRYRETEEQFATTNFLALRHNAGAAGPG
jgi:FkbM family methyltransferase